MRFWRISVLTERGVYPLCRSSPTVLGLAMPTPPLCGAVARLSTRARESDRLVARRRAEYADGHGSARLPRPPTENAGGRMSGAQPKPTRTERDLVDADAQVFLHQSASTPCLSAVRRAEGVWVEEIGGRRFMDFHGNSVHHLGYSHPRLVAALKAQLDDLTFSPRRFTNDIAIALARRLADMAPAPLGKVLLAPSGNDAIEIALRLARVATGRFKTVSFWDSYHG